MISVLSAVSASIAAGTFVGVALCRAETMHQNHET
jgi:hypothetical protein